MRLIDKDKLIKSLKNRWGWINLVDARGVLQEIEKQPVNTWILCSKELPNSSRDVLTIDASGYIQTNYFDFNIDDWGSARLYNDGSDDIVAWCEVHLWNLTEV